MDEFAADVLFVYGTLLKQADHPLGSLMRTRARLIGDGSIRARLYHIQDPDDCSNFYPGAVPSGAERDRVFGEVYALEKAGEVFEVLDHFEACSPHWPEPHEFLRRRVGVTLLSGGLIQAHAYLYTWDVSLAEHIATGRYADWERSPTVK